MPKKEKTVLEILFPQVRAEILRALFGDPLKQRYVRELVLITGLAMHTVQDELRELSAIGLITSWSNGYHRFYRANHNHGLLPHLREIVRLSNKLPRAKHAALRRPVVRQRQLKRLRPAAKMSLSRPPGWDLFKSKQVRQ